MDNIARYEIDPDDAKATFLFHALIAAIAGFLLAFGGGFGGLGSLGVALIAALGFPFIFALLTKPYRFQALSVSDTELLVERTKESNTYLWSSMERIVRHLQKNQPYLILHFKPGGKKSKRMFKLEGFDPEQIDDLFSTIESHSGLPLEYVKK